MNVPFTLVTPILSQEKFAELTGQTVGAVAAQCRNGQLPLHHLPISSRQIDKASPTRRKPFINMAALMIEVLKSSVVN